MDNHRGFGILPDDVIVLTAGFGTDVLARIKVADLGSGAAHNILRFISVVALSSATRRSR